MIQNRTTMLTSLQPASSKWCCSGTIRNTRRCQSWNEPIWMTQVSAMMVNRIAEQRQQQHGPGGEGQTGDQAAEGERAGVAHEDPGR